MYKFSAAAGLLMTLGAAGCSSAPPPPPQLPSGAVPAGTVTVAIQTGGASQFHCAACQPLGGTLTRVTAGEPSAGIDIRLDNAEGVSAQSVVITNVDGFTGSYWKGAQGSAKASMTAQTFTIDGTARGFDAANPSAAITQTFRIAAAC